MVIDRGEPVTGLVGLLGSVLVVPIPRGYSELSSHCESGAEHGVSRCHAANMSLLYLDAALRRLWMTAQNSRQFNAGSTSSTSNDRFVVMCA